MYFVCKSCLTVLKVDPQKVPSKPVYYKCKSCGAVSIVQENLRNSPPDAEGEPAEKKKPLPDKTPEEVGADGTIYHCVSGLAMGSGISGAYELRCLVRTRQGGEKNYSFTKEKITIGRDPDADVTVDDPLVSRHHAELERVRDQVILKDLGSTNGTFVNDEKISAYILAEGDVSRVGNTSIVVTLRAK